MWQMSGQQEIADAFAVCHVVGYVVQDAQQRSMPNNAMQHLFASVNNDIPGNQNAAGVAMYLRTARCLSMRTSTEFGCVLALRDGLAVSLCTSASQMA